jgi:DNA repair exonuclease SbcCD ATPase subunit
VKLKRLKLINFMSHCDTDLIFDNSGLYLIDGDLGAGKSTLQEALYWCIYGNTLRISDVDSVLSDYCDRKNCSVLVSIEHGDLNIDIERSKRSTAKGSTSVIIKINGEMEEYNRVSDADTRIVKLLGVSEKLFTNTVVFGQGLNKFFANPRVVDERERKKILESVMNYEDFSVYQKAASDKVKDFDDKIIALASRKLALEEMVLKYNVMLNSCSNGVLEDKAVKIKELEAAITMAEGIRFDLINAIQKSKDDLKVTADHITKMDQERKGVIAQLIKYESYKQAMDYRVNKLKESSKSIDDALKVDKKCPTCLRLFDTASYNDFNNMYNKEILELNGGLLKLEPILYGLRIEKQNKDSAVDHYTDVYREKTSKSTIDVQKKLQVELMMDNYTREIEATKITSDPYGNIEMITNQIKEANTEIQQIIDQLVVCSKLRDAYAFWVEGYSDSGMKNILFNSMLPYFNPGVNKYLHRFSDNSMQFDMGTMSITKGGKLKDNLNITITVRGFVKHYENCSGGETREVDIAVMFALRDLAVAVSSNVMNILVLDELLDWIGGDSLDRVISVLKEMSEDNLILIITHSEELKSKFLSTNVITVKSTEKGSICLRY